MGSHADINVGIQSVAVAAEQFLWIVFVVIVYTVHILFLSCFVLYMVLLRNHSKSAKCNFLSEVSNLYKLCNIYNTNNY